MTQDANLLVWIDMEMTGLRPEADRIIEVALVVTDAALTTVAQAPVLVVHQDDSTLAGMDSWNQSTHARSGLIDKVKASTLDEAVVVARRIKLEVRAATSLTISIGAATTIDRGSIRDTTIGEATKIDNLCQIGHNVVIGRHCVVVAQCGLSGSVTLEDFAMLGGAVMPARGKVVADHLADRLGRLLEFLTRHKVDRLVQRVVVAQAMDEVEVDVLGPEGREGLGERSAGVVGLRTTAVMLPSTVA